MDIIQSNPYRLMGVYANSSKKDRVANTTRIKAFLKVGKPISFPIDLPSVLPVLERTLESVTAAESQLTIPADQLHFAQFWFLKATPIDEIAFNNLTNGNIDNAISFWTKKDNASSLQNRIVCALLAEDYSSAMFYAEKLYSSYRSDFVTLILGLDTTVDDSRIEFGFLDELAQAVGAEKLSRCIANEEWKQYVSKKEVDPLLNTLQTSLDNAKASKGLGSPVRLVAGKRLMTETRIPLRKLKTILTSSDLQYQMIADKIGVEVLQCGIDYFNGSKDFDAPKKAMELQLYASSVVASQLQKERCQESEKALREIIKKMPPEMVWSEMQVIDAEMLKFSKLPDKIIYSIDLLNNTRPYLQGIKSKLGVGDAFYLRVSTKVVDNALYNLIEEVNKATKNGERDNIVSVVRAAWSAILIIDGFDMESEFRTKRYAPNRSTLSEMYNATNSIFSEFLLSPRTTSSYPPRTTSTYSPPSRSSSSGGCYIATMVYGDYDHPQVMVLREFRDEYLAVRGWGRRFIKFYYKYSPRLVERLKDHKAINVMIRGILDKFIIYLKDKKQKLQREKC